MGLMNVAHCVNVLYYGEIIAAGPMAEIQSDARVRDAYLGA
jgi:ABC-type branched-subunit amino acid transport system ATPase component